MSHISFIIPIIIPIIHNDIFHHIYLRFIISRQCNLSDYEYSSCISMLNIFNRSHFFVSDVYDLLNLMILFSRGVTVTLPMKTVSDRHMVRYVMSSAVLILIAHQFYQLNSVTTFYKNYQSYLVFCKIGYPWRLLCLSIDIDTATITPVLIQHQSRTWFNDEKVLTLYIAVTNTSKDKSSNSVLKNEYSRQEIDIRTFPSIDESFLIGKIGCVAFSPNSSA